MHDRLNPGEILVRICPGTKKVVLAQYLGNGEAICLHNDKQKDKADVLEFIKQHS